MIGYFLTLVLVSLAFHGRYAFSFPSGTAGLLQRAWTSVGATVGLNLPYPGAWFANHTVFLPALALATLVYLAVLHRLRRKDVSLSTLCLWTVALGLPLILSPGFQSTDISDYVVRARQYVLLGQNPFLIPPVALQGDPFMATAGWPEIRWSYGPLFLWFMAPFAHVSSPTAVFMLLRLSMLVFHAVNGGLVWHLAPGDARRKQALAAAYLLSPLFLIESACNAHNDFMMVTFFLLGAFFDRRGHTVGAAISLAGSVLIKLYALPVLLCFLGASLARSARDGIKAIAAAAVTLAVAYSFFWGGPDTILAAFDGGGAHNLVHSFLWMAWRTTPISPEALIQVGLVLTVIGMAAGGLVALRQRQWETPAAYTMFFWCWATAGWFWPWYVATPVVLSFVGEDRPIRTASFLFAVTGLIVYGDPYLWERPNIASLLACAVLLLPPIVGLIHARRAAAPTTV